VFSDSSGGGDGDGSRFYHFCGILPLRVVVLLVLASSTGKSLTGEMGMIAPRCSTPSLHFSLCLFDDDDSSSSSVVVK